MEVLTKKTKKNSDVHNENYWIMILIYFATFLVGMGIVSIIAANWQQIPNNVKLISAVILMTTNTLAIILAMHFNKSLLKQILCLIDAFLIMGVMGLVGQIFNLQANINNFCLVWALCCWPLFLVTPLLLWLWLPMLFIGCHFGTDMFFEYSHPTEDLGLKSAYLRASILSLVIFGYELWMCYGKKDKNIEKPLRFYTAVIFITPFYGLFPYMDEKSFINMSWQLLSVPLSAYILAAGLIFALNNKKRLSFTPLLLLGVAVELILLRAGTLNYDIECHLSGISLFIFLCYAYYHKLPDAMSFISFLLAVWFISTFTFHIFDIIPSLIICAVLAIVAYLNNKRKLFNTAIILAVLRILAYYYDASDLTTLGIYLICSGLLLIITMVILLKFGHLLWEKKHD